MKKYALLSALFLNSCAELFPEMDTRSNEMAHGLGYVMGSLDELMSKTLEIQTGVSAVTEGSKCSAVSVECTAGRAELLYDSCKVGALSLAGSMNLDFFSDPSCAFSDFFRAQPDYVATGRRDNFVEISVVDASKDGQTLTRNGVASFSYTIAGLQRTLKNPNGETVFDFYFAVEDSKPLLISSLLAKSGLSRKGRRMTGGPLKITSSQNKSFEALMTAEALDWGTGCSCPVSGSWMGTVSESGSSKNFSVEMKGCGLAEIDFDGEKASLTLENCIQI